jgi:cytochrome c oxidase cbb3-type subunit 4
MNELLQTILRSAVTVALFALFIALIVWAWSPRRHKEFTDAANLVFDESNNPETPRQENT